MTDWNAIIAEALNELHADDVLTRGAILHNKVRQIASRSDLDFDSYLKDTNQKFSSVVQKVENITIHKRPNTDMFVGLAGAKWPEPTATWTPSNQHRFRPDVYDAFTRISDNHYWYLPDTDEFSKDITEDNTCVKIPVPPVTLNSLLDQRLKFAQESEAPEELKKAIERSPNPLAAFQAAISELRLGQQWHRYRFDTLRNIIQDWAKQNEIEFSAQWMVLSGSERNPRSPQQLLANFAAYMTDEEIRSISVPFRAVEAMYRQIGGPDR